MQVEKFTMYDLCILAHSACFWFEGSVWARLKKIGLKRMKQLLQ